MPRVAPLPPDDLPEGAAAVYRRLAGPYGGFGNQAAILAHVPPALEHLGGMLMALKARGAVPWRYIELGIVTVSALNACTYCVSHHGPVLAVEGVPMEAVAGLPSPDHPGFDAVDRLVIEYAGLVTEQAGRIRGKIFDELRAHFSEAQIVELTLRIAFAGAFNRFNDALGIELEDTLPEPTPNRSPTP
jgi:AhpD family alkylhydroperoxidase